MEEKKPKRVTTRREELHWLHVNKEYLEENFPGMWVAVEGSELVGVGQTPKEAADQARQKGVEKPFFSGVRSKKYQGVYLIG